MCDILEHSRSGNSASSRVANPDCDKPHGLCTCDPSHCAANGRKEGSGKDLSRELLLRELPCIHAWYRTSPTDAWDRRLPMHGINQNKEFAGFSMVNGTTRCTQYSATSAHSWYIVLALRTLVTSCGKSRARFGRPSGKSSDRSGFGSGIPLARAAAERGRSRARDAVPQGGDMCTYARRGEDRTDQSRDCPEGTVKSISSCKTLGVKRFPFQSTG